MAVNMKFGKEKVRTEMVKRTAWFTGLLCWIALAASTGCQDSRRSSNAADLELAESLSLGVFEGPEEYVFGSVRDIRALPNGSFFVLDGIGSAVRWYDQTGLYLGGITASGEGPGELQRPSGIHVSSDGLLSVLDPGNGRINTYWADSGELRFERGIPVALSPYSSNSRNLCRLGESWFLYHLDGGSVVHRYDREGRAVTGFQGPQPASEKNLGAVQPFADDAMNSGMLLCISDPALVISVGLRSERVRAHSPSGDLLWETAVAGLQPEQYTVEEGRPPGFKNPTEGAHVAVSLVRLNEEAVLVQYRFWVGDRRDPDSLRIDSIELGLADGRERARTSSLPLIADISADLFFSFDNEPIPRVAVFGLPSEGNVRGGKAEGR